MATLAFQISESTIPSGSPQFPEAGTALRWYAVYTRPNFEKRAAKELADRNVEHFLPLFNEVHQWKDRKKAVEVPAFPNYLFVRVVNNPGSRLRVLQAAGVLRILGSGGETEPVPDMQIDSIRRMLTSNHPCYRQPWLREGSPVRVKRGPLKGLEGSLVRVKNQLRLVVSISLLSQAVATEIDVRDIEPLATPLDGHGPSN
jgi:transcription antitermination factor NusG